MITVKNNDIKEQLQGKRGIVTDGVFYKIDPLLFVLLGWVNLWVELNSISARVVITNLLRTQKEQDKIYAHKPNYLKNPWKSVHQYGRGIDLSVWNFENKGDEPEEIINTVNLNWDYGDNVHKCALIHDVGWGRHIHLQVSNNTKFIGV